jgi:hypothetical protein
MARGWKINSQKVVLTNSGTLGTIKQSKVVDGLLAGFRNTSKLNLVEVLRNN